jgi:hypothetical protein
MERQMFNNRIIILAYSNQPAGLSFSSAALLTLMLYDRYNCLTKPPKDTKSSGIIYSWERRPKNYSSSPVAIR